jgi:hypothetical protein
MMLSREVAVLLLTEREAIGDKDKAGRRPERLGSAVSVPSSRRGGVGGTLLPTGSAKEDRDMLLAATHLSAGSAIEDRDMLLVVTERRLRVMWETFEAVDVEGAIEENKLSSGSFRFFCFGFVGVGVPGSGESESNSSRGSISPIEERFNT